MKYLNGARVMAITAAMFCLLAGCGDDGPSLGTVAGKVALNGEPLPGAQVMFIPVDGGRNSIGNTDSNGEYHLMYVAGKGGALVGDHRVKVTTEKSGTVALDSDEVLAESSRELLPLKYNSKTELTAVVNEGDNRINFELESQ
ncbi:carboxypeptidase-like regulatory domain-containing protein [Calycomorphotria hydatis]|uniref:Carboxypeptidase regulatory-like domain-containing protein n=1 Tax=Calycomorphotria hydatis TaxID=2528027 RepID=A0A517TEK7_9PLAN|nr:carboxypeptidase-like regulatory domain-containing protein [Calycomorphotria hydatis]QDT66810.1 hypothetical protein V22_40810 [Calycomorphotria hydatis]